MNIDLKTLLDGQLDALIKNHRSAGVTSSQLYIEALAEQAHRKHRGLDFATTIKIITDAARNGKFVAYKELADASRVKWSNVHWSIGPHLDSLIEYCHRRGLPILSAIVVRQPNVADGTLDAASLEGFISGVRRVGISVVDDERYYREEQQRVFAWGREQPSAS
jgi:hypothetical protein